MICGCNNRARYGCASAQARTNDNAQTANGCAVRTRANDCRIRPVSGCPTHANDCTWYPIEEECGADRAMRICRDQNGCAGLYPADCRNTFWPDFAHPRWLCCRDLYCARRRGC